MALRLQPHQTRTTSAGRAASASRTTSWPLRCRTQEASQLVMSFPSLQKPSPPEKETFCYQTKLPTRLVYRFQAVRSGRQKSRGAKPKKCLKKILSSRQALSCSKIDGDASTEWICQNSSGLLLPNPPNPTHPPAGSKNLISFYKIAML